MKAWVKGQTASRVDPALAALVTSAADLAVTFGLHDQLGVSPEQLLTSLLHVAVILTILRTFQLNVPRKPKSEPLDLPDAVGHEPAPVGVGAVDVDDGDPDEAP